MASPILGPYEYHYRPIDIVGTTILSDKTTQIINVDSTASQKVFGTFDTAPLTSAPYGYHSNFPLLMKLFCYDIVTDTTGQFEVSVSGKLGSSVCKRSNEDSFGITWNVRDWASLTNADASVTITPLKPVTSVSMKCVCGLATDYIDRASEGSYA